MREDERPNPVHLDSRFSLRPREVRHVFRRKVDENIVVVQGVWALGMGSRFDRSALEQLAVGAFGSQTSSPGVGPTETI
jgi:hypothetical protein